MNIKYWGITPIAPLLPLLSNSASRRLPAEAKTVISFLFPYFTGESPNRNLSYYCVIPDYHIIAGDILADISAHLTSHFPQNFFMPFVDISPINEVKAAELCGLGNIGLNGLLVNKEYGSLCFIGSIITDLELIPPEVQDNNGCTKCGRCIGSCPTGALTIAGFNPELCLSAITQQKKDLTPQQERLIKQNGLAWGCDHCSLACPIKAEITPINAFSQNIIPVATGDNIEILMKNRAFAYRGQKVILRNLDIISNKAMSQ